MLNSTSYSEVLHLCKYNVHLVNSFFANFLVSHLYKATASKYFILPGGTIDLSVKVTQYILKALQTFEHCESKASLLCFWSGLLSIKCPSITRTAVRVGYGNQQNHDFRHLLLLKTNYSSTGRS